MNATTQIINILTAMGAKPIATTDESNTTVIRVNAPIIRGQDHENERGRNSEKTEN